MFGKGSGLPQHFHLVGENLQLLVFIGVPGPGSGWSCPRPWDEDWCSLFHYEAKGGCWWLCPTRWAVVMADSFCFSVLILLFCELVI